MYVASLCCSLYCAAHCNAFLTFRVKYFLYFTLINDVNASSLFFLIEVFIYNLLNKPLGLYQFELPLIDVIRLLSTYPNETLAIAFSFSIKYVNVGHI